MHNRSGNQHKWRPAQKNEQRLQFPIQQHNSSFRKHGRKHYAFMYNKSDKYLFNPQSITMNHQYSDQHQLSHNNLQHNFPRNRNHNYNNDQSELGVTPPFKIRRKENYSQRNIKMGEEEDSLIFYEKQFQSKTLQRQKLPNIRNQPPIKSGMQYEYDNNSQISKYYNEPINKKSAIKNHTVPQQTTKQSNLEYLYGNMNANHTNSSPSPKIPISNVNSINYYNPSPSPSVSPSLHPLQQEKTPRKRLIKDESNLKIFGTVQNLYDIVHAANGSSNIATNNTSSSSKDKDKDIPYYLHPHNHKIVNPNFIYSPFRAA